MMDRDLSYSVSLNQYGLFDLVLELDLVILETIQGGAMFQDMIRHKFKYTTYNSYGVNEILFFKFLKQNTRIMSSKTKGVAHGITYFSFLRLVEGEINFFINCFIFCLVVYCGRNNAIVN